MEGIEQVSERHHTHSTTGNGFYRGAFFLLLTFVFGNGVSFLVFGIHTASKTDLDSASAATSLQVRVLTDRVELLTETVTDLTAQLRVQKLIIEPRIEVAPPR